MLAPFFDVVCSLHSLAWTCDVPYEPKIARGVLPRPWMKLLYVAGFGSSHERRTGLDPCLWETWGSSLTRLELAKGALGSKLETMLVFQGRLNVQPPPIAQPRLCNGNMG